MTLRTVAADTSSPYRRVTVCEPTASPVARYSDTTACRIFLARPPISTLSDYRKNPPSAMGRTAQRDLRTVGPNRGRQDEAAGGLYI